MPQYVDAATYLAQRGYSCVIQDVRGRNDSEGVWRAHEQEGADGFDTIGWIASQAFSNGDVGTLGGSYPGWVQLAALAQSPPALRTMIVTSSDLQQMKAYGRNGETVIPRALLWVHKMSDRFMRDDVNDLDWDAILRTTPLSAAADSLPHATREMWRRWMSHPELIDTDPVRPGAELQISVPTLHISGWEDEPGQLRVWERSVTAGDQHQALLVGPWDHPGTRNPKRVTRGIDHGDDAVINMEAVYAQWFDRWLKCTTESASSDPDPAVRLFTTGSKAWHGFSSDWLTDPPVTRLVLSCDDGRHRLLSASEAESAPHVVDLEIAHDPCNPVQSHSAVQMGDSATVNSLHRLDEHPNVVMFDLAADDQPRDIIGTVEVNLDTHVDNDTADWCVWLADVDEEGHAVRLSNDTTRVRYLERSLRTQVKVRLGPLSHRVVSGHRLRVYIAGSNFPTVDVTSADALNSETARGREATFGMSLRVGSGSSTWISLPSAKPQRPLTRTEVESF